MILLLGASGYIGSAIEKELIRRDLIFHTVPHDDVTAELFTRVSMVINAAAHITRPSVDLCEKERLLCMEGNLIFPQKVAYACYSTDIPMIHITTGCLFNGDNGGKGWSETDRVTVPYHENAGTYVTC